MTKQSFQEVISGRTIDRVEFGLFSTEEISKNSHIECFNPEFYTQLDKNQKPSENGPIDTRLGVMNLAAKCPTCDQKGEACVGHFGQISLNAPVVHPGFIKRLITILSCVCKVCGAFLIDLEKQRKFRKKMSAKNLKSQALQKLTREIVVKSRNVKNCRICSAPNGSVKKLNSFSVYHEYADTKIKQVNIGKPVKSKMLLTAEYIHDLLNKINKNDYPLLGIRNNNIPSNIIFSKIPVPPSCIRPSVHSDCRMGSHEDDLSVKLKEIIYKNISLTSKPTESSLLDNYVGEIEALQALLCLYVMGEIKGPPMKLSQQKGIRSIITRLKGKRGRFRGNLSGKRVDFSGRTVISPDPNIPIDHVIIPLDMAMTLTFPEMVNFHNIERLRQCILNGPDVHPGACYVKSCKDNYRRFLKFKGITEFVKNLKIGDVVDRHIVDGDVVLFNRQPSLHRISIMAHRVKVMPNKTLRFNECCCTPYNADFDGDEMNIHVPQTYEAKAEAITLMGVLNNIRTPRNGDPLIASVQDFLTGAYILTHKNNFYTYNQFQLICSSFLSNQDRDLHIKFPQPAIMKPVKLWTGKQAISMIINPLLDSKLPLNLRTAGKNYVKNEELCINDSFVVFYNGLHLAGTLDKNIIGSGSKKTIYFQLLKNFNPQQTSSIMLRFNRITTFFLSNYGFSIGLNDVTASHNLVHQIDSLVVDGYHECDVFIGDSIEGRLHTQPGMTVDETLESIILLELSKIRETSGKICRNELPQTCSPLIMALCGSKGSYINISQMIACVGQQAISGKRTPNGFEDRSLPRFTHNSKIPEAKGFVRNSFFLGLSPSEFYFHTMAGREGLVDTAVKTAETGYMQRRLIKCLEDLCVQYDNTVRNSYKQIVQFSYGGDGLDPLEMESNYKPVDFEALYNHIVCQNRINSSEFLSPATIVAFSKKYIKDHFKANIFYDDLIDFIKDKAFKSLDKSQQAQSSDVRISMKIVVEFIEECSKRFHKSHVEPGTTVGAICAQSIGEPATQMTLKTFHFAGVAAMNITQGVPRLKEIINSVTNISTPIIKAHIENNTDVDFARRIKARIEKTLLGEISSTISIFITENEYYLVVQLDLDRIKILQLEVSIDSVIKKMTDTRDLKFNRQNIRKLDNSKILISPSSSDRKNPYFALNRLKAQLINLLIKGYPTVQRAVVTVMESKDKNQDDKQRYNLIIEGNDLSKVIATKNINSKKVFSNNPMIVAQVLGIEAAFSTIIYELKLTMASHGIDVDFRHFVTLAELMCYTGQVLGMTRHGLSKMKQEVLTLASFEGTGDILFDAAFHGSKDHIQGVSESIITGRPISVGTGMMRILQKPHNPYIVNRKPQRSSFEKLYAEFQHNNY